MSASQTSSNTPTWTPSPARTIPVRTDWTDNQVCIPFKYPSDILDYTMDWSAWELTTGLQVLGGLVRVDPNSGLTIPAQFLTTGGLQSALIGGGTPGNWHVSFQVFLTAGRTECIEAILTVLDQYIALPTVAPIMTNDGSPIVDQNGQPLLI